MKKVLNKNRRLTREERVEKLYRIDKIELALGRLVMNLIGGLIGAGLVLGFFWIIGMIMNWAESSTMNMIIFFLVTGGAVVKMTIQELNN